MGSVTVEQIAEQLRQLPPEKLAVVSDFVGYLRERASRPALASERPAAPPRADDWPEDAAGWEAAPEAVALAEEGMADYLNQLQDYEERLARGEIRWE